MATAALADVGYTLQPNDSTGSEGGTLHGPPEKLTLAFATADVVMVGWRLERLAEHLRDGQLLAVRALPARYANREPGSQQNSCRCHHRRTGQQRLTQCINA